MSEAHVNVDMIVQSTGADGTTNMTFTTSKSDLPQAINVLESVRDSVQYEELATDPDIVKVSVVGTGMRSHAGVASTMFRTLSERSINIQAISTSEIKISVLVAAEYAELAVRACTPHTGWIMSEQSNVVCTTEEPTPAELNRARKRLDGLWRRGTEFWARSTPFLAGPCPGSASVIWFLPFPMPVGSGSLPAGLWNQPVWRKKFRQPAP